MEEHQNARLSTGPSELYRSYYTGNSLSALHSSQQVHVSAVITSVHPRASTQRLNDTTPSCSALGSQLLHGHIGSPVLAGPIRNVTGEAMPTSLAEALAQLSFLEFVQRCNLLIAPSQPTQLPVTISFLDVAVQTAAPCEISQDCVHADILISLISSLSLRRGSADDLPHVSPHLLSGCCRADDPTQYSVSARFYAVWFLPSFLVFQLVRQCRLLSAVWCNMMLPHNSSSRSSSLAAYTRTALWTAKTLFVNFRHQCRIHMCYLRHRPVSNSQSPSPELAAYSHLLANVSSSSCHTQQSPVCTTHVGTHPVRTASCAKKSASTALAKTHNSTGSTLRTDAGLFPKPKAVILPMVNFGHPQSNGPGPIATADSDLMHHQFRLSLLQWNPGPARRNPTNIVSAACGRFHAVILQEASHHVPHISDYFRAYTDNM